MPAAFSALCLLAAMGSQNAEEDRLWKLVATPLLKAELWSTPDRGYTACALLMVPLHSAFNDNNEARQKEFSEFFKRYMTTGKDKFSDWGNPPRMKMLQFLFMHSEFIRLAAQKNKAELIPEGMPDFLASVVDRLWTRENSIAYNRGPFPSMKARLVYKLDLRNPKKSYERAIIDEEKFIFAIASDLVAYSRLSGKPVPHRGSIDEVVQAAYDVYSSYGSDQPGGGWMFGAGTWTDHADYQYANDPKRGPNLRAMPVPGIGEDSSHSHRMPLWLTAQAAAYPDNDPKHRFFVDLRNRLEKQFFNKVLVPPTDDFPSYRTTNYMDGRNGVYRFNYKGLGEGGGHDAYELSGTFLLGWWTFLGTERIRKTYEEQAAKFPLPENLWTTYISGLSEDRRVEVNTTKANNERGLLCRLAARIGG